MDKFSFVPPPPPPPPPPQPSSTSSSSISVPAFLSTLLQQPIGGGGVGGNIFDYHSLSSSLTNHLTLSKHSNNNHNNKMIIKSRLQMKRKRSRSPSSSQVSTSDDNDQIVSTSGQIMITNNNNNKLFTSGNRSNYQSKINRSHNDNNDKQPHSTMIPTYPFQYSSSLESPILLQAHQNDTHDSLAASMPLLSSYLRSNNGTKIMKRTSPSSLLYY
ncbi:hypothetical protein BLA29_007650 [Euroglyphus maynei]|uniref:Uncharacterized protein n=1 Tax=Euroglyphus maynei TaxID=6958 RepID=A0A1Y3BTE8_EURMA|nr:hypothetical protein BLA29_007650 [Euroglyphus maynei]